MNIKKLFLRTTVIKLWVIVGVAFIYILSLGCAYYVGTMNSRTEFIISEPKRIIEFEDPNGQRTYKVL